VGHAQTKKICRIPSITYSQSPRVAASHHATNKAGRITDASRTHTTRKATTRSARPQRIPPPERKRRFVQEARTASALNHPNIITIYDIDQADGTDFIAMEFVPGKPLDRLVPRKGLRLNEALQYATQVADALAAHAAGIVHRDLKPGNVMVNESGGAKVLDFALAKLTEHGPAMEFPRTGPIAEAPKTDEGMIVGTVSYMSPEQTEGKKLDARTDIFSFGAVLYEMITGRRAFVGDSIISILSAILRDEPKPAAEIAHGLPRELDRIVTRCHAEAKYADSIFRDARGDRAGSIVALQRALEAMPTYAPAILSMDSVSYQAGSIAAGRELFQSLLLLPKNTPDIQIIDEAGTFLTRFGAYEDGMALYRKAVKRYPDVPALFQGLGYCASKAGLHAEAVSAGQRALELEPGNQKLVNDLGWALLQAGRLPQARDLLERAVSMDPSDEPAKGNLRLCRRHVARRKIDEDGNSPAARRAPRTVR